MVNGNEIDVIRKDISFSILSFNLPNIMKTIQNYPDIILDTCISIQYALFFFFFFNTSELNNEFSLPMNNLSLLHIAAYANFLEAFIFLNSIGIPISIQSSDSFLPIHYACSRDSLEILLYIISKDPSQLANKYNVSHSLLYYAVESEDIRIIKALFSKGYTLVEMNMIDDIPNVINNIILRRPNFLPYLMPKFVSLSETEGLPNLTNKILKYIFIALKSNYYEPIKYFLENYSKKQEDIYGYEELFFIACKNKQKKVAKLVLDNMEKVKDKRKYSCSILYALCELCSFSMIKYVFDNHLNSLNIIKLSNARKEPPLFGLLRNNNIYNQEKVMNIIQLFLDKGYDINFQPEGTNTFLSEVCLYNYSNKEKPLELIRWLLMKGANPLSNVVYKNIPLYDYLQQMSLIKCRRKDIIPIINTIQPFIQK